MAETDQNMAETDQRAVSEQTADLAIRGRHSSQRKADQTGSASEASSNGSALVLTQGAGLPPRDRSFDRNEQHRAALGHHPANAARPRRAV